MGDWELISGLDYAITGKPIHFWQNMVAKLWKITCTFSKNSLYLSILLHKNVITSVLTWLKDSDPFHVDQH